MTEDRIPQKTITQIIYTGFGGLGSVAFSLVSADTEHKHSWMIGFIGDQPIDPSYPPRCAEHGVEWAEFRSTPGRPYRAWWQLARWLDSQRPDVVLLHSINSILPARWYAWRRGAKLIAVEHTPNAVKTRKEWMASRLSMLLADKVVVLTPEYREELAQAQGRLFRPGKVALIPNGIDTDVFHPVKDRGEHSETIRLGMAARFSFSKRQELLIRMMPLLRRSRPDIRWCLSLAGDGERFEEMQRLILAPDLADVVTLEGRLSEQEIAPWLRSLDIYVHSSDGETLSTSLLQAMATGLPIVASDIPGIANLLREPNECGICVPNDVAHFSDAIMTFADAKEKAHLTGMRARAVCVDQYSHTAMLCSYLSLLGEDKDKDKDKDKEAPVRVRV